MKPDYYSILCISRTASPEEIKAAFRRLAMLYHPDKNPGDPTTEDKFRMVMEAYDVLSDPGRKKKYDSGRSYQDRYAKHGSVFKTTKNNQKDYSFTDEDQRKRQEYYEKFRILKEKRKQQEEKERAELPSYSDFKYIMISIPLAVALLFFAINSFRHREEKNITRKAPVVNEQKITEKKTSISTTPGFDSLTVKKENSMEMNVSPWNKIFGMAVIDSSSEKVIRILNHSGSDVVICLQNTRTKKVIRNNFILNNYFMLMKNIPEGSYYLKVIYGDEWTKNKETTDLIFEGNFDPVYGYAKLSTDDDKIVVIRNENDTLVREIIPYKKLPVSSHINNHDFFYR